MLNVGIYSIDEIYKSKQVFVPAGVGHKAYQRLDPRTKKQEIKVGDVWSGKAFRSESGYEHERNTKVHDVVKHETEELGNDIKVPKELLEKFGELPASRAVWVTRTKKEARYYDEEGSAGAEYIMPPNSVVIGRDDEGGYLVVKGGMDLAKARVKGHPSHRGPKQFYVIAHERQTGHLASPPKFADYNVRRSMIRDILREKIKNGEMGGDSRSIEAERKKLDKLTMDQLKNVSEGRPAVPELASPGNYVEEGGLHAPENFWGEDAVRARLREKTVEKQPEVFTPVSTVLASSAHQTEAVEDIPVKIKWEIAPRERQYSQFPVHDLYVNGVHMGSWNETRDPYYGPSGRVNIIVGHTRGGHSNTNKAGVAQLYGTDTHFAVPASKYRPRKKDIIYALWVGAKDTGKNFVLPKRSIGGEDERH